MLAVVAPVQLDDPHGGCSLGEGALVLHSSTSGAADWRLHCNGNVVQVLITHKTHQAEDRLAADYWGALQPGLL
jgi:hypothetical protein